MKLEKKKIKKEKKISMNPKAGVLKRSVKLINHQPVLREAETERGYKLSQTPDAAHIKGEGITIDNSRNRNVPIHK